MIGVDVGGTFTDIVAIENGLVETRKVATNVAESYKAVIEGAQQVDLAAARSFNHASTHGLNAIITRRLPKVALLTTSGHRDILDMGNSWRPMEDLTNARWSRTFSDTRAPIVPRYLRRGIVERLQASGAVFTALDEDQARRELEVLRDCDVQGIAICLLHSYTNAVHELRLRELVTEVLGDGVACSISSEVSPLAKEYARASTTVVDVAMKIVYGPYTQKLVDGLAGAGFTGELNFADCSATLAPAKFAMEFPSRIVFSGPAAGTVASAHFGELIGVPDLICADVGGTSCDISVVMKGQPSVATTFELEHDLVVNTLSNEISSIGAGGGSIVSITPLGEIRVGPGSAGADPGPACYGRGGTVPTMTDICLLVGILDGENFAGGSARLDPELSLAAFERLETTEPVDQLVGNSYRMGINNIAEGIFNIVIKSGVDPRDYSLIAYGAAGPMLLPAVLDLVHVKDVIVPPHAGLFSALGLLSADQVYADSKSAYTVLTADAAPSIDTVYRDMEDGLLERLGKQRGDVQFLRSFDGQLMGQFWDTPFVPVPDGEIGPDAVAQMVSQFHDQYEERSGNRFESMPVQGVTYRVSAIVPTEKVQYPKLPRRESGTLQPRRTIELRYLTDVPVAAGEYERTDLLAGDELAGPAIIREALCTTHIHQGQVARVGDHAEIIISKV